MGTAETSERTRTGDPPTDPQLTNGTGATTRPDPAPHGRLKCALDLGWRMAELYAQTGDLPAPATHGLLPAHDQLPREDQLELQVRAAAGDARQAGAEAGAEALVGLVAAAREVPDAGDHGERFRERLLSCHVALEKQLWAQQEAAGKAYELGIGISDTYSRVCRGYRANGGAVDEAARAEWLDTFSESRVERIKKLLNDLESRLDPSGVTVVNDHLDAWRETVRSNLEAERRPPPLEKVKKGLRRQTVIWRQLLTGDKSPEAYLDRDRRSQVQDELRKLVWKGYRRWAWVPVVVAFLVILALLNIDEVTSWYEANIVTSGIGAALLAVLGAFGVTKASVALTLRKRVDQWSQLLWNKALATKVTEVTLTTTEVFEPEAPRSVVAKVQSQVPRTPAAPRPAAGGRA